MKRTEKRMIKILYYLLIVFAVVCIVIFAVWKIRRAHQTALMKKAQEITGDIGETGEETDDPDIDFDALMEINADIYAWIYVPGTNINYPILQSGDDKEEDYYLEHNLDGTQGKPACIYTQKRNSKDFTDPNTVIYGHNMRDGSMFRTLHEYEDAAFFAEHSFFYIYTPDEKITYQIFAAYRYSNTNILEEYDDFWNEEDFGDYLEMILNQDNSICNLNRDVEVSSEDTIVTLSTCIGDDDYRYLVQGVRVD